MLKMSLMKAEEKLNHYGQYSVYIMRDPGISMRCSIKRKRFQGISMSTVSERNGLMQILLQSGKKLAMKNFAVCNASSRKIIIMEELAYAESLKDPSMKER